MNMNDYRKVTDRIYPSDKCREEVMNMRSDNNRKKIKHRHTGKAVAAIAVAVVAVCGGTVAAAEKIGSLHRLNDTLDESSMNENGVVVQKDKFNNFDYEPIAHSAQEFTEPILMESDSYSITVESVYCDGRTLVFGLSGSMKNDNPDGCEYIFFGKELTIGDDTYSSEMNDYIPYNEGGKLATLMGKLYRESDTDNEFIGSLNVVFNGEGITEPTDVSVELTQITNSMLTESSEQMSFEVKVVPDLTLSKKLNITAEHDGFSTTVYESDLAMLLISSSYPKKYDDLMRAEHDEWLKNSDHKGNHYVKSAHPVPLYFDENGNYIEQTEINPVTMPDGETAMSLQSTNSKTITVKWGDTNCTSNENGSVEFDNQYGHFSLGYITEYTIDLGE